MTRPPPVWVVPDAKGMSQCRVPGGGKTSGEAGRFVMLHGTRCVRLPAPARPDVDVGGWVAAARHRVKHEFPNGRVRRLE